MWAHDPDKTFCGKPVLEGKHVCAECNAYLEEYEACDPWKRCTMVQDIDENGEDVICGKPLADHEVFCAQCMPYV